MTAMLDSALGYAARGWPVFPCRPGRKDPLTEHGFLDASTSPEQITAWWTRWPDANIGIATGHPGPDVIDFDTTDGEPDKAALSKLMEAGVIEGRGDTVRTRSGGYHLYFTGTQQRNGSIRARHVDFRSSGGYVIAPPSRVDADDKPGGVYQRLGKPVDPQGEVDWRIIQDILDPPPPFRQPQAERAALEATGRPGDYFAAQNTWADILEPHEWVMVRQFGDNIRYWRRPGKTGRGISASTHDDGGMWVFTTSTDFQPEQFYSKFGAWALLNGHGSNYAAAAAALREDGYGDHPVTLAAVSQHGETEHTSWYPRDLIPILDGDATADPLPAFLTRDDHKCILYRAKINAFIGESESGKTWAALIAVAQALASGLQVLYLDFEDAAPGIIARLRALGIARDQVAKQFRYIAPDERPSKLAVDEMAATLADPVPDLIVVDGVNAAMTLLGYNLKDNKDATNFSQQYLRPLKRTGAAVLTVDHVTKDRESRGSYAIGAQAKRADIDGAAFIIEATRKFGRGQEGRLKFTISKDRPGHVRAISAGAIHAGTLILTPAEDGTITAVIQSPDMRPADEKPPFRPTGLMQKVSRVLEQHPGGMAKNELKSAVRGKGEYAGQAIEILVEEGYIAVHQQGQTMIHKLVRPYSEALDQQITIPPIPTDSQPVPADSPEPVDVAVPGFPPVPGGGAYGTPGDRESGASTTGPLYHNCRQCQRQPVLVGTELCPDCMRSP